MAATLSSQNFKTPTDPAAQLKDRQSSDGRFVQPSDIELYPEIAAQLAGYVNSPYRKQGSLLLIDVGAGTLDVSTIILHGDRDRDIVSFHFCDVASLGVLRRYQAATEALEGITPGCVKFSLDHFQDGSRPVPESLPDIVHRPSPALEKAFQNFSKAYAGEILDVAHACLGRFRLSQRRHHSNPAYDPWGSQLRFFLTGGGCRSPFYREHLADGHLENRLIGITSWHPDQTRRRASHQGLVLQRLPAPNKFRISRPPTLGIRPPRVPWLAFGGENNEGDRSYQG